MHHPAPRPHLTGIAGGLVNRLAVFALLVGLTFALPRLIPGNPLDLLLSSDLIRALTLEETRALRREMGLNGSWLEQFFDYCLAIMQGDFGYSVQHAAPVTSLLLNALPWTGLLILGAVPVSLVIGVLGGIEAGRAPHRLVDRLLTIAMTMLLGIPPFMIAILLLVLFGITWPLFPVGGSQSLFPPAGSLARTIDIVQHAALPAIALAMHEVARFYFLCRGEAESLTARPFLIYARARGVSGWRERLNYYGRNLLPAILARMSDSLTALVSAVLFVEIVFSYPGIGRLIYEAILDRDYVLLQGAILGVAAVSLTLNWVIDAAVTTLARRG
tara:strand:+ start:1418 stop:2407 length:990 start_codon:yes stop_codon:yes gene_type:complete